MLHVATRTVDIKRPKAPEAPRVVTIADAIGFVRRRALPIFGVTLVALALAITNIVLTPPSYVAAAKILIESQKPRAAWQEFGADVTVDSAEVESQAEVLRSANIASQVIKALDLVQDREFVYRSRDDASRAAVAAFNERLSVRRVGQSNVIEVAFASSSPVKASRIANEIVTRYLDGSWRGDQRPNQFRRFNDQLNRESMAVTNAQFITAATPPLGKSSPKTLLVLTFSIVGGLLLGLLLALGLDSADRRIRELSNVLPGQDVRILPDLPLITTTSGVAEPLVSEVAERPFSEFTDALRAIRLALDTSSEGARTNCIGVMSVESGAGTTTIATNLAALYAQAGQRALLVDANFRNPALSRQLAPQATKGLVELIRDREPGCFAYDERLGISVLPLVASEKIANSVDILRSAAMAALLRKARPEFDAIVVDLPPSKRIVDGRAMASLLDQMIFVAEYGKTRMDDLESAIESAGSALNSVVLNKHDVRFFDRRLERPYALMKSAPAMLSRLPWPKVRPVRKKS